jgi:hypothetical protein
MWLKLNERWIKNSSNNIRRKEKLFIIIKEKVKLNYKIIFTRIVRKNKESLRRKYDDVTFR